MKTHAQILERMKAIQAELERLKTIENPTDEDRAAVPDLLAEFRELDRKRLDMEHDAALAEVRAAGLAGTVERPSAAPVDDRAGPLPGDPEDEDDDGGQGSPARAGRLLRGGIGSGGPGGGRRRFRNPWDVSSVRTLGRDPQHVADEIRSRALDAIQEMRSPYGDAVREVATRLVEQERNRSTRMAELVLASSSPTYMSTFEALVDARGDKGILDGEQRASLLRAMSLTDSAGGFLVPFQLDPAVINTADGSENEIRQISRTVQIASDTWHGVSSAGVTASWDAEAAEVSDDAATFAQPSIPVHKLQLFVPISVEAEQDEQNVAREVAGQIAFAKDVAEGTALATGSGSGQPTGIVTALVAAGGSIVRASATSDTFALADVYGLKSALPMRYKRMARWLANDSIYDLVRQFDTTGGASLWTTLGNDTPPQLLGKPVAYAEAMDGVVNATANNYVAIFGDFRNYVVVDRIGTTIEYVPTLFGANGRPTGQRGWHAWARVGADSVNDGAFRLLNVT